MPGDTHARSMAIQGFVDRLTQVRDEAGRPSFREMAKRSGAISHATLHDALQGARMPSWETTVEFATACGTDPEVLRADWEQAAAIVRANTEGCAAEPPDETEPPADGDTPASPAPAPRKPVLGIGLGVTAVAVVALVGAFLVTRETPSSEADSSTRVTGEAAEAYTSAPDAPSTTTGPKGCPANVDVRPGTKTLVPGDASEFAGDVTIADCSTQERGRSVVKTWAFANTGTVEWTDRFLHRINVHEGSPGCRAPERVAIPDTEPGETVEVSVTIATPDAKATCFGRWMQTDGDGNFTFPEQRPYYYTFKVT
ncbi:NBR1-Ig-like domain-containing protein [Janibacter sp. GS2]|uniref:NBR1-Ig-like domain-containing protein n=1 Tax=Janibacter sp. GS2 TaxID=3442646 RepID=UPI003EBFC9DF